MRLEPPREAAHLLHRAPTRRERSEGVEEFVGVVKLARCEEVEYGPELSNVVLDDFRHQTGVFGDLIRRQHRK